MKTYSEQRQAAYFRAAREMYRVATQILDDSTNDAELTSEATHEWVKNQSRITMERGRELEEKGHEERIATVRQENALFQAKMRHAASITAYEQRRLVALKNAELR